MSTMDTASVIAQTIRLPAAAKRIRVPERTLRNWVTEGRLPAIRVGGRLRVHPDDLAGLAVPVVPKPKPEPPAPPPPLSGPTVTAAEAARRLGMSKSTVYDLIETGRLRAERAGRQLWVAEADLAAYERLHNQTDTIHAFAALDRLRAADRP